MMKPSMMQLSSYEDEYGYKLPQLGEKKEKIRATPNINVD